MSGLRRSAFKDDEFGEFKKRFRWTDGENQNDPFLLNTVTYGAEYLAIESRCVMTSGDIIRVQNQWLWGCYRMMYEEKCAIYGKSMVQEEIMYHVTSPTNAVSIATENFDWRRKQKSRFGQGVCFATTEKYGYRYARYGGATLVCGVLKVQGKINYGGFYTSIPDGDNDSTVDNKGNVLVKYQDDEYYPYYIAYRS